MKTDFFPLVSKLSALIHPSLEVVEVKRSFFRGCEMDPRFAYQSLSKSFRRNFEPGRNRREKRRVSVPLAREILPAEILPQRRQGAKIFTGSLGSKKKFS